MPTPIESIALGPWDEGLNRQDDLLLLKPNEASDCLNVIFTRTGSVQKRKGFDKITTDVANQAVGTHMFVQPVYTTSGAHPLFTEHVYYVNNDNAAGPSKLFRQTVKNLLTQAVAGGPGGGADFVDTGHEVGTADPAAINYFRIYAVKAITWKSYNYLVCLRHGSTNVAYTVDGTVTGQAFSIKYDAQAGTFSRPTVHDLGGATSGFPQARQLIVRYDRIFAANVYKQGVYRYPSRIYWSVALGGETWESDAFIDVGADDTQEITGLYGYGEQIYVFKNRGVFAIGGTDGDTFSLFQLSDDYGSEADYTIREISGKIFFYDTYNGVMAYDGATFENVSRKINQYLLDGVNRYAVFKSFAWVKDNKYYLSVPWGEVSTSTTDIPTRTFVYDTEKNSWTEWDYGISGGGFFHTDYTLTGAFLDRGYFYGSRPKNATIGVIRTEVGYSDDGVVYTASFQTPWLNPGGSADKHRLRRMETIARSTGGNVKVDVYRNINATSLGQLSFTAATTGGLTRYHHYTSQYDNVFWTWIRLKFQNATIDEDFELLNSVIDFSSRKNLRGDVGGANYTA